MTDADWAAVSNGALAMMASAGVVDVDVPIAVVADPWDAPSWREAAIDYHRHRPAYPVIAASQLAKLRWLMNDGITLERAWAALNSPKGNSDDRRNQRR
jgi:hypothetical protein